MVSSEEQGPSAKKQSTNQQQKSKASGSNLPESPVGTARVISQQVADTRGPNQPTIDKPGTNPEVDQQIQTTSGNDLNERGSLIGESGNRKLSKRRGPVFGIVEVSNIPSIMSRVLVFAFTKKEYAENLIQVVEALYGHTKMQVTGFKHALNDDNNVEHLFYWVLLKLGFNLNYESIKSKFGKAAEKSKWLIIRNIQGDIESDEEINNLKNILQILYTNNAGLTTLEELVAKETSRKEYHDNFQASKKRKINFD